MKYVVGTLFFTPASGDIVVPQGWRTQGKANHYSRSLDDEFPSQRFSRLEGPIAHATASLPPGGVVDLALWIRSGPRSQAPQISFDASAPVMALDSIWVEIDQDSPVVALDELTVFGAAESEQRRLLGQIATSNARIRQQWFTSIVLEHGVQRRLYVELRSRGGGDGIIFERDLLRELSARGTQVTISGHQ